MADGWPLQSMAEKATKAQAWETKYIGIVAERLFDRYPGGERLKYMGGSSGFVGFAKGGCNRTRLEKFHANMSALLGERWREWGTEQCGSNFAVANSPEAIVLAHPQSTSFYPGADILRAKFFHFIGTHRFEQGFFAARAREVIRTMESR
jgi:hypothetical protein